MNVRIEKKSGFSVAGVILRNIGSPSCPGAWDQLYGKYSPDYRMELWIPVVRKA